MSSHHVIRDEQEPPIIILTEHFNMEFVNDLLGWSPVFIVSEEIFPIFETRDIKVDYVIGNGSANNDSYFSEKYINGSDLEDLNYPALDLLLQGKSYTGVNIFCSETDKANLVKNIYLAQSDFIMPINLFVGEEKTILTPKNKYVKWYPVGQKLVFNSKNISSTPSLGDLGDYFIVETAGKYEFVSNDGIIIITEL